jgi:hypothetical protein
VLHDVHHAGVDVADAAEAKHPQNLYYQAIA